MVQGFGCMVLGVWFWVYGLGFYGLELRFRV